MLHATCSSLRKRSAFTLIELLVVIAIIAILAGLAFPAMQGALNSGKKAQARNDVAQLVAAVKAFQLEYGRLPSTRNTPDTTADSTTIMALIGSNSTLNPKAIVFFEPKIAKGNKNGLTTSNSYNDPWGNPYTIILDTDYNNRVSNAITTVVVSSTGGSSNTNDIISNIK